MKRILFLFALLVPSACWAQSNVDWFRPTVRETARQNCEWNGNCERWYRYKRWDDRRSELRRSYEANYGRERWDDYYRRQSHWDGSERKYWPVRAEVPVTGRRCHPALIEDHSIPMKSEKSAVAQAWEHWMIKVMGEPGAKYMDPDNSTDRYVHCYLAQVGTGLLGGIDKWRGKAVQYAKGEESAGQADGLARVCTVWARPCRDGAEPVGHEGVLRKPIPEKRRR